MCIFLLDNMWIKAVDFSKGINMNNKEKDECGKGKAMKVNGGWVLNG